MMKVAQQTASSPEWKRAICGICPAGCWVELAMSEGRIREVREDPTHPLGMICRRGSHAPEIVYSQHRLRQPLRRTGPKGTHAFEPLSWEQAYEIIVERLQSIKLESGPEAVAIYTGRGAFELSLCDMFQPRGVAVSSASNVLFPFGSPNTMGVGALCYVSFAMIAPHLTLGRMLINMFADIENAELLLVWGANPATDSPPLDMERLEAAAARGAEIIVIDPRRTETVRRTGARWVPIRPGTDGALALSMIQVMVADETFDEHFAKQWCHGFEELAGYVQHFTPEDVEPVTGVPAETIRELARALCNATGACPVMYTGLEYSNSGIQAIRAVLTLFALAGHLDVPGGIGLGMLGTHFPINRSCNQENPDLGRAIAGGRFPLYTAYRGESHASGLLDSVLRGEPYRIRSLIIHGASLLTSWPQTAVWREALSRLEFQVCIDRQLTADAAYADIVLPATTMFEIDSYMTYGPIFRLRERIIEPVGEARNDYLIMAELAHRLGYGHLYPQTEEAMIRKALEGSGYTLEEIKEAGGWVKIPTPMIQYRKWEKGGLRRDGRPGFETPTSKFEIHSTVLEDYGYEPLPKYVEPREGPVGSPALAREYPLVFNSGSRTHTAFRSQDHGVEGLVKDDPEPVVEIHPDDASARDILDGDLVEVSSPRGRMPFRARVTTDIIKGAVECSMGGGTPVGPQAWREWNVNELTDVTNYDEISGFPVYKALLCDVQRIGAHTGNESTLGKLHLEAAQFQYAPSHAHRNPTVRRIYLDNNATTQVADSVREEMLPYLDTMLGNPSSIHRTGREAREAIDLARRRLAELLHTLPRRIIFTGGGSEANNLALKGTAFRHRDGLGHIITTRIEHPAVLSTCAFLEAVGYRVTYLDVDSEGWLAPSTLADAIAEDTILVSVMMANNEVGTILPIRELCSVAHSRGVLFHTDAVQAAGKIDLDVENLGVDMLSISAHKFHGPKGVGALWIRKDLPIVPLIHGGRQERGLRAGTENVPAIVGLGKAAELAFGSLRAGSEVSRLRDQLQEHIQAMIPDATLNGHPTQRLPGTLNMTLPGLRGESIVVALDQHGIALSSGSACKSGSPEPTHVLLAMGRSAEEAHCAVRFSLSRYTTKEEIEYVSVAFRRVLEEMETTVRFLPCK